MFFKNKNQRLLLDIACKEVFFQKGFRNLFITVALFYFRRSINSMLVKVMQIQRNASKALGSLDCWTYQNISNSQMYYRLTGGIQIYAFKVQFFCWFEHGSVNENIYTKQHRKCTSFFPR